MLSARQAVSEHISSLNVACFQWSSEEQNVWLWNKNTARSYLTLLVVANAKNKSLTRIMFEVVLPSMGLLHANASPFCLWHEASFWNKLRDFLWKHYVPVKYENDSFVLDFVFSFCFISLSSELGRTRAQVTQNQHWNITCIRIWCLHTFQSRKSGSQTFLCRQTQYLLALTSTINLEDGAQLSDWSDSIVMYLRVVGTSSLLIRQNS